jgi:hypothetical protein
LPHNVIFWKNRRVMAITGKIALRWVNPPITVFTDSEYTSTAGKDL